MAKIVPERSGPAGKLVPCETWDNAQLFCEVQGKGQRFPMLLETKRIAPGEANTWYIRILGTAFSVEFSTKYPKTLRTMIPLVLTMYVTTYWKRCACSTSAIHH